MKKHTILVFEGLLTTILIHGVGTFVSSLPGRTESSRSAEGVR